MNEFVRDQDDHRDGRLRDIAVNQAEIIAFQKAMEYLKFSCEETDSLLYAGSDSLNSLLCKMMKVSDIAEASTDFYNRSHPTYEIVVQEKVQRLEQELPHVQPPDQKQTQELMKSYMYPFLYSGEK